MAEEINTGGLHRFVRPKGEELRLDEARKNEIREAYAAADERKARERRNRIIFWIIGFAVGLAVLALLVRFLL